MKKIIVVLVFILCLALGGCVNAFLTPTQDKLMADIFNAIENNDYYSASQSMSGLISEAEIDKNLPVMSDYIKGTIKEYTKIGYYYHVTVSVSGGDKTETETLTYSVKTEYDEYVVQMVLLKTTGSWNVYSYNIVEASQSAVNGSIIDFNDFNILQLIMLVFSAASLALVIFTIVMYAKSRIRLKALWIILIIVLQTGLTISKINSNFNASFLILCFDISKLLKYANGDYVFTLIVPVGAIVFLCLRKRLISSTETYYQRRAGYYPPVYMTTPQPNIMPVNTQTPEGTEKEYGSGEKERTL